MFLIISKDKKNISIWLANYNQQAQHRFYNTLFLSESQTMNVNHGENITINTENIISRNGCDMNEMYR